MEVLLKVWSLPLSVCLCQQQNSGYTSVPPSPPNHEAQAAQPVRLIQPVVAELSSDTGSRWIESVCPEKTAHGGCVSVSELPAAGTGSRWIGTIHEPPADHVSHLSQTPSKMARSRKPFVRYVSQSSVFTVSMWLGLVRKVCWCFPTGVGVRVIFQDTICICLSYCNPGNFRKRLVFVLFVSSWSLWKLIALYILIKFPGYKCTVKRSYYPGQKKRTIIEIRGKKNAVPRVISCSIRRDQHRASSIRDCPRLLPCADRAWSSMISHVEQRSSRRESRGWFFFLSR